MTTEAPKFIPNEVVARLSSIWDLWKGKIEFMDSLYGAIVFDLANYGPVIIVVGTRNALYSPAGPLAKLERYWGSDPMPKTIEVVIGGPQGAEIPNDARYVLTNYKRYITIGDDHGVDALIDPEIVKWMHEISGWYSERASFVKIRERLRGINATNYDAWQSLRPRKNESNRFESPILCAQSILETTEFVASPEYSKIRARVVAALTKRPGVLNVGYIEKIVHGRVKSLQPTEVISDALAGLKVAGLFGKQFFTISNMVDSLCTIDVVSNQAMARLFVEGDDIYMKRLKMMYEVVRLVLINELSRMKLGS